MKHETKSKTNFTEEEIEQLKEELHGVLDEQGMLVEGAGEYSFKHCMDMQGKVDSIVDRWLK